MPPVPNRAKTCTNQGVCRARGTWYEIIRALLRAEGSQGDMTPARKRPPFGEPDANFPDWRSDRRVTIRGSVLTHYELTRSQSIFSAVSIAAAFLLVAVLGVRIGTRLDLLQWWAPLAAVPFDIAWGAPVAIFGFGFCTIGMMTNQIHQWAHMASPPRPVRVLQDCGLILGRAEHAAHHKGPNVVHYCISTGWWNRPLEALGFFRCVEGTITRLTGVQPRQDDRRYEARYGAQAARHA